MESRIIRTMLWTFGFMVHVVNASPSPPPAELILSQVAIRAVGNHASQITVYANLLDINKVPIQSMKVEQVTVALDGRELTTTQVQPFRETGEGVAYTLLLDVSKTMKGRAFTQAREATKHLIRQMRKKPADWVAVITFGDEVRILSDFVKVDQRDKVLKEIDQLEATSDKTHLYQAILDALSLNKRIDSRLPVRRALFIITDGKDEGSGIQPSDLETAMERNPVPIYSVGYTRIEKTYLDSIKRLAKLSGGTFIDKSTAPQDLPSVYEKTVGDILKQWVIRAEVSPGLKVDGYRYSVKVTITQGSAKIYGEKTVAFFHESVQSSSSSDQNTDEAPQKKSQPSLWVPASNPTPTKDTQWWGGDGLLYGLTGIILTIILSLVWLKLRNPPAQFSEPIPMTPTTTPQKIMPNTTKSSTPSTPHFQVQFLVIEGPQTGKQMLLPIDETGVTIGRQSADLVINDSHMAKIHCVVQKRHKRLVVKADYETFINGIPVSQQDTLENDDVLFLGESKIRIRIQQRS